MYLHSKLLCIKASATCLNIIIFGVSVILLARSSCQHCKTQMVVLRISTRICFTRFHHVSVVVLCWQDSNRRALMRTGRPCQSPSSRSWWCVWADVWKVTRSWRSQEVSGTSGKVQLSIRTTGANRCPYCLRMLWYEELFGFVWEG